MTAPYGRRGLPPGDDDPELPVRPRRVAAPLELPQSSTSAPRRGIVEEPRTPATRQGWIAVAALGLAIAVLIGVLSLIFGSRDEGAMPAPQPSPTSRPTTTASDTGAPVDSGAPLPTAGPTDLATASATPDVPTETPTPPSDGPVAPVPVTIDDDVTLLMPANWELYADEIVQNERRLVRLRETDTDVRIQAVSLTTVTSPLDEACLELVADHRQSYTDVAEGLPVAVPISGEGEGRSCNFTGTRVSDDVAATVEFTLLQLGDSTLVFRDTIPATVADGSPVLAELVAMECGAAADFGVAINQCAITPDQGDG